MLNANAEKKGTTKRDNVIFAIMMLCLIIIAIVLPKFSDEDLKTAQCAPTTTVEEQIPSSPSAVMQETEKKQDVLSCKSAEISRHCNSGVLFEQEIKETIEFYQKRQQFPHYGEEYELTEDQYLLLCKLVKAEATSMEELKHDYPELSQEEREEEHHKEMTSIAAVTLKRTTSIEKSFPDELEKVIFQEGQFSTAYDGEIHISKNKVKVVVEESDITEDIMVAVDEALDGTDFTEEEVTDGAIFFYSDKYISSKERAKRANVKEKIKYGDTVFYR